MGISSSMNAGVSGLNANANKLSTISDNIANSQTNGYKRADTDFHTIALDYSTTLYTAGGVRTTAGRNVDAKASLIPTSNATDIAISGRGMLPVTDAAAVNAGSTTLPLMLTSTGSFKPDANGVLRTDSGLVLMGWPADANGTITAPARDSTSPLEPVVINRAAISAEPTENIKLAANLPASATKTGAAMLAAPLPVVVEYFDTLGAAQTMNFSFAQVSDGATPPAPVPNQWELTITNNATAPASTLGTYTIEFDATMGSGGTIENVTAGAGSAPYDPATGMISLDLGNGQVIEADIGAQNPTGQGVLTQLSEIFQSGSVTKDGASAGSFRSLAIDETGNLSATYSNGFSKTLYRIPVADVPNMDGLKALNNQTFEVTAASGSVYFWDAGTGPVGSTQGFSLEGSTTDIGQELTELITTQRAYSSNAKIIQTVDEMLQETTNLKR